MKFRVTDTLDTGKVGDASPVSNMIEIPLLDGSTGRELDWEDACPMNPLFFTVSDFFYWIESKTQIPYSNILLVLLSNPFQEDKNNNQYYLLHTCPEILFLKMLEPFQPKMLHSSLPHCITHPCQLFFFQISSSHPLHQIVSFPFLDWSKSIPQPTVTPFHLSHQLHSNPYPSLQDAFQKVHVTMQYSQTVQEKFLSFHSVFFEQCIQQPLQWISNLLVMKNHLLYMNQQVIQSTHDQLEQWYQQSVTKQMSILLELCEEKENLPKEVQLPQLDMQLIQTCQTKCKQRCNECATQMQLKLQQIHSLVQQSKQFFVSICNSTALETCKQQLEQLHKEWSQLLQMEQLRLQYCHTQWNQFRNLKQVEKETLQIYVQSSEKMLAETNELLQQICPPLMNKWEWVAKQWHKQLFFYPLPFYYKTGAKEEAKMDWMDKVVEMELIETACKEALLALQHQFDPLLLIKNLPSAYYATRLELVHRNQFAKEMEEFVKQAKKEQKLKMHKEQKRRSKYEQLIYKQFYPWLQPIMEEQVNGMGLEESQEEWIEKIKQEATRKNAFATLINLDKDILELYNKQEELKTQFKEASSEKTTTMVVQPQVPVAAPSTTTTTTTVTIVDPSQAERIKQLEKELMEQKQLQQTMQKQMSQQQQQMISQLNQLQQEKTSLELKLTQSGVEMETQKLKYSTDTLVKDSLMHDRESSIKYVKQILLNLEETCSLSLSTELCTKFKDLNTKMDSLWEEECKNHDGMVISISNLLHDVNQLTQIMKQEIPAKMRY